MNHQTVSDIFKDVKRSVCVETLNRLNRYLHDQDNCTDYSLLVQYFGDLLSVADQVAAKDENILKAYLDTVGAVLYKRSACLSKYHEQLINKLDKFAYNESVFVQCSSVLCIRNITMKSHVDSEWALACHVQMWCYNKFLSFLYNSAYYKEGFENVKILSGCLEGVENLFENGFKPDVSTVGHLFASIAASICVGIPGVSRLEPIDLKPFTSTSSHFVNNEYGTAENTGLQQESTRRQSAKKFVKSRKQHRSTKSSSNLNKTDNLSSQTYSESSDSESQICSTASVAKTSNGNRSYTYYNTHGGDSSGKEDPGEENSGMDKLKRTLIRTRLVAFRVFNLCSKVFNANTLFGYWFRFFPDPSNDFVFSHHHRHVMTPSFMQILLKESSFKIRIAALAGVQSWLNSCRPMLASAEIRSKPSSFTSFSETLAASLIEIHKTLCFVISAEQYHAAIIQCLKCFEMLISVAHFDKLPQNLLTKTLKQCQPFVTHRDSSVRSVVLNVYSAAMKINSQENMTHLFNCDNQTNRPWIFHVCYSLAQEDCVLFEIQLNNKVSVRVSALNTLIVMHTAYGDKLKDSYATSLHLGFQCLSGADIEIVLHGFKLLNALFEIHTDSPDMIIEEDNMQILLIRFEEFMSPPTAHSYGQSLSANIVSESLELYTKLVIKNILVKSVETKNANFLRLCSENGPVQTTALRLLPNLMKHFLSDLHFVESSFDRILTIFENASANVAEKAGASLIFMTRVIMTDLNDAKGRQRSVAKQRFVFMQRLVLRVLRFARNCPVLRLKPACVNVTNLFLENCQTFCCPDDSDKEIVQDVVAVIRILIPLAFAHCQVQIVKVQQTALESATAIFSLQQNRSLVDCADLSNLLLSVIDVLNKPTLKLRNKFLASEALSTVPVYLWTGPFQGSIISTINAFLYSLESLDDDAHSKSLPNSVKDEVAKSIVHNIISLLRFCTSEDLLKLALLQKETVQKALCYYIDLYKSELFRGNELSKHCPLDDKQEMCTQEFLQCLERLETLSVASKENMNLILLISFVNE